MDTALNSLLAASIVFVGSHFAMSHPLRAPMVRALGEKGFLGVYSLISLVALGWMIWAFRNSPTRMEPVWSGYDEVSWTIASLLTIVALVLLLGSFRGNPALPHPDGKPKFAREPQDVYRVTRHPMMWALGLWGIAHILIMPTGRTLIFAGAITLLALLGAHLQDRKKRQLIGADWREWESKTSYWPRWLQLVHAGWGKWIAALALWLFLTWAHIWLAYVPAGIWRWVPGILG